MIKVNNSRTTGFNREESITTNLSSGCYYGNKIRERLLRDLTITECIHPPEQVLRPHSHERPYFCLILQGSYTESYGGATSVCKRNLLILHPEGERHSNHVHREGCHLLNIAIGPGWAERLSDGIGVLNQRSESIGRATSRLMDQLYQEFQRSDTASSLIIEGLVMEVMGLIARQNPQPFGSCPPRWLEQCKEMLNDRYLENWSLTTLAESIGIHPTHMARMFHRHYNCTIGDYIRHQRIQYACSRLNSSETSLSLVAQEAGFADQSHFCRTFKRIVGETPAIYRASRKTR